MTEPQILCGLETEYGIVASSADDQAYLASALIDLSPVRSAAPWLLTTEGEATVTKTSLRGRSVVTSVERPNRSAELSRPGSLLANGGRLYVDHAHPEYSTPECDDAYGAVVSERAGDRIIRVCRRRLADLVTGPPPLVVKNNSDGSGHSYGSHENYQLERDVFADLLAPRSTARAAHLVPFLATRQIFAGAGKVGAEPSQPSCTFQLSQRADFFVRELGPETMYDRPLVNTRDEPHADGLIVGRLHLIVGDSNMADLPALLKVAATKALLECISRQLPLPDLELANAVAATRQVARDLSLGETVPLSDGRKVRGIEIQLALAEAVLAVDDELLALSAADRKLVWAWYRTLEILDDDLTKLDGSLDWVTKLCFLEKWRDEHRLDWDAPELREIDVRYHDIDPEGSIYWALAGRGEIQALIPDEEIEQAIIRPAHSLRAQRRAELIEGRVEQVAGASWGVVMTRSSAGTQSLIVGTEA